AVAEVDELVAGVEHAVAIEIDERLIGVTDAVAVEVVELVRRVVKAVAVPVERERLAGIPDAVADAGGFAPVISPVAAIDELIARVPAAVAVHVERERFAGGVVDGGVAGVVRLEVVGIGTVQVVEVEQQRRRGDEDL